MKDSTLMVAAVGGNRFIFLAATPLFTRLFSPYEYGLFATFLILPDFLAGFAAGRYESVIQLPKEPDRALRIFLGAICISLFVSFFFLFALFLFSKEISTLLGTSSVAKYLFLAPFLVFAYSSFQSFRFWFLRNNFFAEILVASWFQAILGVIATLVLGSLHFGVWGIIWGYLVYQGAGVLVFILYFFLCPKRCLNRLTFADVKKELKNYLPLTRTLILSEGLISSIASRIPSLLISHFANSVSLGFFSMAERVTSLPALAISNALGDVFRQKAIVEYQKTGSFRDMVHWTFRKLLYFSFFPFFLFFVLAPFLFPIVLGPKWHFAGKLAQPLILSSFFDFIISPIDKFSLILEMKKYLILKNLIRLVLLTFVAFVSSFFSLSILGIVWLIACSRILFYLMELFVCFRYVR